MRNVICLIIVLVISMSNMYSQINSSDKSIWSTYKSLNREQILSPGLKMRQQHDHMEDMINNLFVDISNLKKSSDDKEFVSQMDVYLERLKHLNEVLQSKGVGAINTNSIPQIYKDVNRDIENYKQKIDLRNERMEYINKANIAIDKHRYLEAIENITKAINIDYNNSGNKILFKYRGLCKLYGLDKPYESTTDLILYSKLCETNTTEQADAFFLIGEGFQLSKMHPRAVEFYTKSIEINNSFLDAYLKRGISLSKINKTADAISDYDYIINYKGRAKESFNEMATVYNNKASCLIEMGEYDSYVLDLVNKALDMNNRLYYIWDTRGEYYYHNKMYKECIENMNQAIELYRESGNSYYFRGLSKIKMGKKTEGCKDLNIAVENGSINAEEDIEIYCK